MKLLPTLVAALLFQFALTPIAVSSEEPDRGQSDRLPNILFIVSDDHGWGDLPSNWDATEVRFFCTVNHNNFEKCL